MSQLLAIGSASIRTPNTRATPPKPRSQNFGAQTPADGRMKSLSVCQPVFVRLPHPRTSRVFSFLPRRRTYSVRRGRFSSASARLFQARFSQPALPCLCGPVDSLPLPLPLLARALRPPPPSIPNDTTPRANTKLRSQGLGSHSGGFGSKVHGPSVRPWPPATATYLDAQ